MLRHDATKIALYFLSVAVLGALLTPVLFQFGKGLAEWPAFARAEEGLFAYLHRVLSTSGFPRYFNRAVLLAAVLLFFPFARWIGLRGLSLGFRKNPFGWGHLLLGFGLAAGILLAGGWGFLRWGAYEMRPEPEWWNEGQEALTAAIGVSLLEEFFFRGLLVALVLRSFSMRGTWVFVTVLFAVVHFLQPQEGFALRDEEVGWDAGFRLLASILENFVEVNFLLAELLTLLAVGAVLGAVRWREGSIWGAIGLHAGWVFGLKLYSGVSRGGQGLAEGEFMPWLGENLRVGLFPCFLVVLTGGLFLWLTRPKAGRKLGQSA
ncbi:MAG: CPBP family intramembrane glutamic endopeptidase [Verrucomicrobiota bacterium]